jgi:hypothetical protein
LIFFYWNNIWRKVKVTQFAPAVYHKKNIFIMEVNDLEFLFTHILSCKSVHLRAETIGYISFLLRIFHMWSDGDKMLSSWSDGDRMLSSWFRYGSPYRNVSWIQNHKEFKESMRNFSVCLLLGRNNKDKEHTNYNIQYETESNLTLCNVSPSGKLLQFITPTHTVFSKLVLCYVVSLLTVMLIYSCTNIWVW